MDFSKIKNIIFDLGNVIINIDFDLTYQAFEKLSSENLDLVYQKFNELKLWERYETGEMSNQTFIDTLRTELKLRASDEEIIQAWNALLLDVPIKRVELMKKLSKKYRLFILSNTSELHIIDVNRILHEQTGFKDLKDLVEHAFYSYEMGLRKPNPDIYMEVLEDCSAFAGDTLFLDDNLDNILSAQAVGMHCIHVTDKDMCEYLKNAI
jgi:glucose-1-phosphatase